jgi:ketosteroid isomerase-like protein
MELIETIDELDVLDGARAIAAPRSRRSSRDTARAMSAKNVAALRDAIAALNERGVEAFIRHLDPEIEWVSIRGFLPDAEDRRGHDGVRAWFAMIAELFEHLRWEPLQFRDAGDRVVVETRMTGIGSGSGILSEVRLFSIVMMRGGKASRLETYIERDEALEAAGLAR